MNVSRLVGAGASLAALLLAVAPVTAKPLEFDRYEWSDSGTWSDCGPEYEFEAYGSGVFFLKQGRAGDATPYLFDNYEWHWLNTNPENGKWFREDGNGIYKDLRITNIEGTIYSFTAIEAGRPYTITDMEGNRVLWDRGVLETTFVVDTKGDDDLSNDEHLSFDLVKDAGSHPIWYKTSDEYCVLVNELLGD